ncbi:AbrB/MazE/SpoVT family DNA-binding domain-containing protein [Halobacteria archaeon AArc-m2/3/4]|uniref:AbrB/MazE/SpoVT family DNA-binding domain-containing protein n=1 Tax=Natronoglomus mannanivorans TaxID=2979990 RepID=A0AAP2Z515_9EURY|nr:AbrB/MazE/SpoVT family DNA-binding domain-containing protein [Halobacteria archaeon AArc-xg1-1]MCU4974941.1 AbrB/MazE/SpoVT family DNA-binding domain-containing protein [Halobacteria archaeon AArc-m2/3/4]
MAGEETHKVGERGQVTLPKHLREALDIDGGDEVTIREEDGKIVIERPVSRKVLAEGYRRRAEQYGAITEEMGDTSREANAYLAGSPDW